MAAGQALDDWKREAHFGGCRAVPLHLAGAGRSALHVLLPSGAGASAAVGRLEQQGPSLILLIPRAHFRPAVAETMVQMECDYVTPSYFREMEKEFQAGRLEVGAAWAGRGAGREARTAGARTPRTRGGGSPAALQVGAR